MVVITFLIIVLVSLLEQDDLSCLEKRMVGVVLITFLIIVLVSLLKQGDLSC